MTHTPNLNLKTIKEIEAEIKVKGGILDPEMLKAKLFEHKKNNDPNHTVAEPSKLNPETEIFTESDPDEIKIRKSIEEKFSHNKKNKNQPL
ncbi:MAG: hypothetical protein M3R36_02135 [Bacteroidota bacterium]|nr:hypothetical protein [Bacteroidota bacterium]